MENLDYNGLYEYLYQMKYQEHFPAEGYSDGIPKEEFESLMMEYLPVTSEELQEYAVFDEKTQTYAWERLGYANNALSFFGTSTPEVVEVQENSDGTVTLKVDAVCDMVICDDVVLSHELTVRFRVDGSFQYLSNQILGKYIKGRKPPILTIQAQSLGLVVSFGNIVPSMSFHLPTKMTNLKKLLGKTSLKLQNIISFSPTKIPKQEHLFGKSL